MVTRLRQLFEKRCRPIAYSVVIGGLVCAFWFTRERWMPASAEPVVQEHPQSKPHLPGEAKLVKLSEKARSNLNLQSGKVVTSTYWRNLDIPGIIVDRQGLTDRGVNSPIAGVVTRVHKFEGEVVRSGETLFTIQVVSEHLQEIQLNLFKSVRELQIQTGLAEQMQKLLVQRAVAAEEVRAINREIIRQTSLIEGFQQDLLSRGLDDVQIAKIKEGEFLRTIVLSVPVIENPKQKLISPNSVKDKQTFVSSDQPEKESWLWSYFEVQQLSVEVGQQVIAGQQLSMLADHHSLFIEGHAFKKEIGLLANAAERERSLEVEFEEELGGSWPELQQEFRIHHIANFGNEELRTFDFFIPLLNQARTYGDSNKLFVNWRFRPGQRVRISVPVEKMEDVIVVPVAAVVFEGPEAFVFQQNGDLFKRLSVRMIHQDRKNIVIANDASVPAGAYLAQGSASSLNRVLQAQAAAGMRNDVHMHADGSSHGAH